MIEEDYDKERMTEYNGVIERGGLKAGSDSEIYLPYNTIIVVKTDNFRLWLDIKKMIKNYYINELGGEI